MPVNEIHVDDIGTIFEISMNDDAGVVDLSSATTTEFLFKKLGTKLHALRPYNKGVYNTNRAIFTF